ncbi:cbb3-type cytochrome c oxidase subunit II [Nocardioides rubriscoriae]|uniref:cbb3-type cytochrome c oxidase subunit II n=1 Tax=Nocardioides rubriscoriae TaxID=642762 RepID=UPI0011DF99D4|nr:cbb3-type cytochrome c oxidase subunit II [Nocardioides rubriscoriae]
MDQTAAPRSPRLLLALLAALLVVVVATSLVLLHDRRDAAGIRVQRPADIGNAGWTEDSAGRAVVAARTAATTYFTLDHRTIKADMAAMRALGTPGFVDEYDARAKTLAERIVAQDLVLSARLPRDGTATEYLVTDRAVVLVSVDVTTARVGAEGTTRYRTRVGLDLVDGRWLVASLDEVA